MAIQLLTKPQSWKISNHNCWCCLPARLVDVGIFWWYHGQLYYHSSHQITRRTLVMVNGYVFAEWCLHIRATPEPPLFQRLILKDICNRRNVNHRHSPFLTLSSQLHEFCFRCNIAWLPEFIIRTKFKEWWFFWLVQISNSNKSYCATKRTWPTKQFIYAELTDNVPENMNSSHADTKLSSKTTVGYLYWQKSPINLCNLHFFFTSIATPSTNI